MSASVPAIAQAGRRFVRHAAATFAAVDLALPLVLLLYAGATQ